MLGVTFGNIHSYDDWGIWLEDTHINPPLPKRYIVDVPARNGVLDLTAELTPTVRYQARQLTFKFRIKSGDWNTTISQIYGDVHGKTLDVTSDLDPNWHWHGCVMVNDFASDRRTGVLVIIVDAEPFKLSNTENQYTVNGNGTATAVVDRMEVSPTFEITAPTTVEYGDLSAVLSSSKTQIESAYGIVATFNDGTINQVQSLTADINAIQEGDSDPSPTNIRPISGWTSAIIHTAGKNMLAIMGAKTGTVNEVTYTIESDGGIHASGTTGGTPRQLNLLYTVGRRALPVGVQLKLVIDRNSPFGIAVCYADKNNTTVNVINRYQAGQYTFTIPASAKISWARVYFPSNTTFDDSVVVHPMIVASGETNYNYTPYVPTTYQVSFTSAGTIYGGEVDVTAGTLTVTHKMVRISDCNWTYNSTYTRMQTTSIQDIVHSVSVRTVTLLCSSYLCIDDGRSVSNMPDKAIYAAGNSTTVYIKDTSYTNADTFKTAMGDQTIVYPLETPITYQLSNVPQVWTLQNWNNVWSDTGDSSLAYIGQDFTNAKMQLPELELPQGNNTLTIKSTGTTKITYRNGRL